MSSDWPVIWFTLARKEVLTLRMVSARRPLPSAKLLISSLDSLGVGASPLTSAVVAVWVVEAAVVGVVELVPATWLRNCARALPAPPAEVELAVDVGAEPTAEVGVVPVGALMRAARAEDTPGAADMVAVSWDEALDDAGFAPVLAGFTPLCGDFPRFLSPPFLVPTFFLAPPTVRDLGRPGRPKEAAPPPEPLDEPEVF